MSQLGKTFTERYCNFFKFFADSQRSIKEITSFIKINSLPKMSSSYNKIHLNMIDTKNLNILFHIIRKSKSDNECLEKLKLLIEQYNINYNIFDINRRTLPFYTCVKGYLNSTKYLIEKMDYDITIKDNKDETLFFSAIRSYNIELVKYLDKKYIGWLFEPNKEYNSCIFNIFKKSMKDEGENKIKNLFKFIIEKGFNIEQKNSNNVSFRDLCTSYKVDNYLDDVLKEKNKINSNGNSTNNIVKDNKNKKVNGVVNHINGKIDIKKSSNTNMNKDNNQIKKKETKDTIKDEEKKINSSDSSTSLNHVTKNTSQSNVIKTNGITKNSEKKEIMSTNKKEKKKCCLFVTRNNELINNKIYEKLASHEVLKERYLNKINNSLEIPSFEKGRINIIRRSLSKED